MTYDELTDIFNSTQKMLCITKRDYCLSKQVLWQTLPEAARKALLVKKFSERLHNAANLGLWSVNSTMFIECSTGFLKHYSGNYLSLRFWEHVPIENINIEDILRNIKNDKPYVDYLL